MEISNAESKSSLRLFPGNSSFIFLYKDLLIYFSLNLIILL